MRDPARIIDANANRAREALRVMEDAARFLLDLGDLSKQAKELRHTLGDTLARLPHPGREIMLRDTPGDVGTAHTTPGESTRHSVREVVIAAGKRLGEALRSLEEFSKVLAPTDPGIAQRLEELRYHAYDLEMKLVAAMGTGRATQWTLCVIITEELCTHHNWLTVAQLAIMGGADCLQLREKHADGGDLLARARLLVRLAEEESTDHKISVVINDRPDIALLAGADGVHLGQADLAVSSVRKLIGFDLLVGVSTSNLIQAKWALQAGADYCGVGPMFPTSTKQKDTIATPAYLAKYLKFKPTLPPHLAIGGITKDTIKEVVAAGARGVAVSSAVCSAKDPMAVCEALRSAIDPSSGAADEDNTP
ncbi:MAG: thiamine phosphate synthase [Phycisphaerales bacterium]